MIGVASSQVPSIRLIDSIGDFILDSINNSNNNILRNNIGEAETIGDPASSLSETGTDRVWREGIDPSVYTWTPQTFSGFYYDPKNDVGTERLTVRLRSPGRTIDSGDLRYITEAQDTQFEFHDWGSYQVIGFLGEKYFAGYDKGVISDTNRSLISDGQLRKVLVDDSDNESTLTTGSALPLEEGYELRFKRINIDGNKVYLSLAKDGDEVDSKEVSPEPGDPKSSTYKYEVNISGEKTALVLAHISNVFASTKADFVTIDGLFQISDTVTSVDVDEKYDNMKITTISDLGVEMANQESLSLKRGNTTKIFGNVVFRVADTDVLRFAPIVQRTGTYNVRGTVIDPSLTDEFTWTPYNFEGFYYDIDDDAGTETLEATISGGNKINERDLIYTTRPQPVKFKFNEWGKYDVMGFMGDKYFAGYSNENIFANEAKVINEGQLRRILLDSDDSQTIASGSAISLQEGYELRIGQVGPYGNKVNLSLAKDGVELDSKVVTPSGEAKDRVSNYIYDVNMGSEKDVPMIAAHVQSIFTSTKLSLVTVDAVFQVSDSPVLVEEGDGYGIMKVESVGSDGIAMQNNGTISLVRGDTIDIMGNLRLDVADNAMRLLTPIATKTG
jgi:S-layer protein (TIGR01567 family)